MIDFALETITPIEAARILEEHDNAVTSGEIINRQRKSGTVRRYAADLTTDQWYAETAETLKFQSRDKLLHGRNLVDGQNRLAACVEANKPLTVYVARGVAREAFSYIDGGDKRNLHQVLFMSGEADAGYLAKALMWMAQWDADSRRLGNVAISTARARKLLDSDPAIRKSVTKAKEVRESKLLSVGVAAFLHRVFANEDRQSADAFIVAVASGARLEADDPFFLFRQRLIENKGSRRKLPQRDLIALAIKAWNAKRAGKAVRMLRYSHKQEEFPVLGVQESPAP